MYYVQGVPRVMTVDDSFECRLPILDKILRLVMQFNSVEKSFTPIYLNLRSILL